MNKLNCTNVKAASWLDSNENIWIGRDLSGDNNLLLVTTRKSCCLMIGALCRANIKLVNQLLREFLHLCQIKRNALAKNLLIVALKNHVLGNRKWQDQAPTMTVRRNSCNCMINDRLRGCTLNLFIFDGDGARLGLDHCVYGIGKFFLAVAVDTRKTNNLTGTNIQIKAVYLLNTTLILDVKVLNRKHNLTRSCWLLFNMQINVSTHHKCCKLSL